MRVLFWKKQDPIQKIKNKIESLKISLSVEQYKLNYYTDLERLKKNNV